jgi:hypothetical protein
MFAQQTLCHRPGFTRGWRSRHRPGSKSLFGRSLLPGVPWDMVRSSIAAMPFKLLINKIQQSSWLGVHIFTGSDNSCHMPSWLQPLYMAQGEKKHNHIYLSPLIPIVAMFIGPEPLRVKVLPRRRWCRGARLLWGASQGTPIAGLFHGKSYRMVPPPVMFVGL